MNVIANDQVLKFGKVAGISKTADHALTWPLCQLPLKRTKNVFVFCSWPWSAGIFSPITALNTVSDQVESILMFHLTMEAPTDHPYHSKIVDYILMLQLTMVSWPCPQGIFPKKQGSEHVESNLMFHLTMKTLTDHPYHSKRVDYFLMLQLTMVSWGFSS